MREIPVTEARAQLSDLVSRVAFGGEPVLLTRHGKALVALVPAALLSEAEAASGDSRAQDGLIVLDVTTPGTGRQDQYTIAAQQRDTDEHPRR